VFPRSLAHRCDNQTKHRVTQEPVRGVACFDCHVKRNRIWSHSCVLCKIDVPGGAFESEDLLDPPGLGFIRPGNRGHPARDGDLDLAALSERGKSSRIPAEQDGHPVAKCWRGGNRYCCYGSPGRSCYGSPSGRSPAGNRALGDRMPRSRSSQGADSPARTVAPDPHPTTRQTPHRSIGAFGLHNTRSTVFR